MGSSLFEGKNERWYSFRNRNLKRLKMEPGKENNIIAGEPLRYAIQSIGTWVGENILYSPILDMISGLEGENLTFHPFGYDWRLELWDVCPDLHNLLSQFDSSDEIIIVAHSMGGLLTHTYCQWAEQKKILPNIKTVITIGTPWKGAPDSYKALRYGIDKGFFFPSKKTVAEVGRTFPSLYQLLPSREYCYNGHYLKIGGRELTWKDSMDHIKTLSGCNVRNFDSLNMNTHISLNTAWPNSIEHFNIIGFKHGSVGTITIMEDDQDLMTPVDGDGTVPIESAKPSNAFNSTIVYAHATHQGLTNHKPVLEWIQKLIGSGKPSAVEGVYSEYTPRTDWIVQRIACPVDVFIEGEEDKLKNTAEDITRHTIGEVTYLIHNNSEPKPITVIVEPYDSGRTEIETIKIVNNKVKLVNKFPSINADPTQRTIIELSMNNENPETKIKLLEEDEEISVLNGIDVIPPERKITEPPNTQIKVKALGKNFRNHYDSLGVEISFKFKGEEDSKQILETLFRINGGRLYSYSGKPIKLDIFKELVKGRNTIEYFSRDIFDNLESTKKREVFIHPIVPEYKTKIELHPETGIKISLISKYIGVKYEFKYKFGETGEERKYTGSLQIGLSHSKDIFVKAIDDFETESEWRKVDLDFSALADELWDESGYTGGIRGIIANLPQKDEKVIKCLVGKVEKDISEDIPKSAKTLEIIYTDTEYLITLLPTLDVYLDYHSQIISRDQDKTTISFLVYDANDNPVIDLKPTVKYYYLPTKQSDNEVFYPKVTTNKKGVYTFEVNIKNIPSVIQKIKFEFRDVAYRKRPLETRAFKLQ